MTNEIHIGQEIEKRRAEIGMSKVTFSAKLGLSRQSGFAITQRTSINTALLQRIGQALDFDFFLCYTNAHRVMAAGYEEKLSQSQKQIQDKEQQLLQLKKEKEQLLQENQVMKKLLLEKS